MSVYVCSSVIVGLSTCLPVCLSLSIGMRLLEI